MGQPFGLHSGPGEGISGRRSRGANGMCNGVRMGGGYSLTLGHRVCLALDICGPSFAPHQGAWQKVSAHGAHTGGGLTYKMWKSKYWRRKYLVVFVKIKMKILVVFLIFLGHKNRIKPTKKFPPPRTLHACFLRTHLFWVCTKRRMGRRKGVGERNPRAKEKLAEKKDALN